MLRFKIWMSPTPHVAASTLEIYPLAIAVLTILFGTLPDQFAQLTPPENHATAEMSQP